MIEFLSYDFGMRALLAGLVVGLGCAVLAFFVVLRRMAFVGVGISHAALGGVAIGVLVGIDPMVAALGFSVGVAWLIGATAGRGTLSEETAIGIFFPTAMALGVALMAGTPDYRQNLLGYLFGNILLVRDSDLILAAVLVGGSLLVVAFFFKELLFISVDEETARAAGLPATRLRYLLLTLLALTIVSAIKVVGIVLVSAFIVIPAATAQLLAPGMRSMLLLSVVSALVSVVGGLWIAWLVNLPSGAAIVLLAAVLFFTAMGASRLLRRAGLAVVLLAVAGLVAAPADAATQEPDTVRPDTTRLAPIPAGQEGWNDRRVRELVERARIRRARPVADSALRNYRADVSGHIYFFIDREDEPEPVLLRADQVALELYWAQPDRVKQVIHGMRSEEQFPIRDFRYYLDRYTVIQNGFDDVIRVGEGRDVRDVVHPLAAKGERIYDYRLGDSTTIRLPGEPEPIRVYEIQVRPRDFDLPAIVGSLFVERARGDLVRLAFTFTPASYLDPRNERVEVVLENALWEGRYWLPREQRLLVRREIPEIDLDVGTVIRAALRVEDYALNVDLPDGFFGGRPVIMAAGPERLAAYDFDEGLFEGLEDVGLDAPAPGTLDAVDVEAITGRILRDRFLRGVPRVRFFAPSASDVIRYDRSEGLVTGAGLALGVGQSQTYAYGGWAWGGEFPLARVGWRPAGPDPGPRLFAEAYLNRPVDLGLRQPMAGVLSSVSAAVLGADYRDIVAVSGATLGRRWGASGSRTSVVVELERVRRGEQAVGHAPFDDERRFRAVPAAPPAWAAAVGLERQHRSTIGGVPVTVRSSGRAGFVSVDALDAGGGMTADGPRGGFVRLRGHADARWTNAARTGGADASLTVGAHLGQRGPQHAWYFGGAATLPGHAFHEYGGTWMGLADVTAWRSVIPRIARVRAFGALGWAGGEEPVAPTDALAADGEALAPWSPGHTAGLRASLGVGLGLVDDILRIDYALRTDTWDGTLILSVRPDLWSFL